MPPEKLSGLTHCIGRTAVDQIFRVINEQSQPTFDEDFNFISFYNWTGQAGALSPMVDNGGNGEPKAFTGLVGTHHRPSDDLSVFGMYFFCAAGKLRQMHFSSLSNTSECNAQCRANPSGGHVRSNISASKRQSTSKGVEFEDPWGHMEYYG